MTYREVSVIEVKEILRLWLGGRSLREVTVLAAVDRKTVRRYVEAARTAGLARDGGAGQLSDELLGMVVAAVRPARPRGTGTSWETVAAHREQITTWLEQGLTVTKVHVLLERRGVAVPYRTLHRFAVAELGFGRRRPTVPVADGDPGVEVQVDFGRLGLIPDPSRGNRRVAHGLIFTAVYSRHMFVFPTHRQTLDVIAGFDAAWAFYGGYAGVASTIEVRRGPCWRCSSARSSRVVDAVLASSAGAGRLRPGQARRPCGRRLPGVRRCSVSPEHGARECPPTAGSTPCAATVDVVG